ncbi:MAG: hypothetical protein ACTHOE_06940 [Conexibacter sp.]
MLSGSYAKIWLSEVRNGKPEVSVTGSEMHSRTVGGLLAYCDWLKDKGYQGAAAAESWKSATKKVFETVEPDGWETVSLDGLDLDDYTRRFQTLAGAKLRAETVGTYKRRIQNAVDAHVYYLENGKPPSFKRGATRKSESGQGASTDGGKPTVVKPSRAGHTTVITPPPPPAPDFHEFTYPLSPGRIVTMQLPVQMSRREIDRLCTLLQTLEEQPQLPAGSGEEA